MSDNPYLEAAKYETARRREAKRHAEAVDREAANHVQRLLELRQALSPAAARIVVAAEGEPVDIGEALAQAQRDAVPDLHMGDPNPAPDWLNKEPAPLPAGALLEVEHKPRKRA